MAKLGWFSVVGAVAVLGTSAGYAAWTSATARSNGAESSLASALLDAEPAQLDALASAKAQLPPEAPALTAAEFMPVSATPIDRPATRKPTTQARAEAAPAATLAALPAKAQEPRRAAPAATPTPAPAAARTQPLPQPKVPPVMASDRGTPEPRLENKAETKDAGAMMLAQVVKMKRTLRLSPDQQEQWAAVEAALRDIARQQSARKAQGARTVGGIALTDEDTNKLYWAAAPLIMNLREEQKRDARQLARAMGLEQVAAAF